MTTAKRRKPPQLAADCRKQAASPQTAANSRDPLVRTPCGRPTTPVFVSGLGICTQSGADRTPRELWGPSSRPFLGRARFKLRAPEAKLALSAWRLADCGGPRH
eukprot:9191130-Alexandrium_andersonii.AAC.1